MSTNQFEELQLRYMAGDSLSSQEAERLLQWLDDNADARQELLIDEAIDSQLRCLARINDEELAEEFVKQSFERTVAARKSERIHIVVDTQERNRSRSLPTFRILTSVSAAALLLVVVAYFTTVGRKKHDFGFAKIVNVKDLSWELIDDANRRVRVSSGSGEVHFENGTVAQFSAPTVIELKQSDTIYVKIGLVKVNVPPPAVGFTVDTPTARIVDYGTKFNVDVDEAGQTETLVRSGVVTFENRSNGIPNSDPIKLTAEGLNRASTKESLLTGQLRSLETMASGTNGQFYGTVRADGKTVEFTNRQEWDNFHDLFNSSSEKKPSSLREQSNLREQATGSSASAMVESSGTAGGVTDVQIGMEARIETGNLPGGRAQEMLMQQLRAMRGQHEGNDRMQQLLDGMIQQVEQGQSESPQ